MIWVWLGLGAFFFWLWYVTYSHSAGLIEQWKEEGNAGAVRRQMFFPTIFILMSVGFFVKACSTAMQ
jgi:hypothetical protein